MEQPRLPVLACPFPSAVNPHAELVDQQTVAWAHTFKLLAHPAAYERLATARVGWLIAHTYPTTPLDALRLLADWSTWLLVWDDQCGAPDVARQPDVLRPRASRLLAILAGAAPAAADMPLAYALQDLRQRLVPRTNPAWLQRFGRSVDTFFAACAWEATNRAARRIPAVATYIKMRPATGGLATYIDLFELTEQLYLPAAVRGHATVRRLTLAANNVVCWINDLLSLDKELAQGDVHNLVLVLQHAYGLPLQAAIDRTAALYDAEVRTFIDLASRLPSFGPAVNADLQRYLAALRNWMRGSLDWSSTSGRYLVHLPEAPDAA